MFNELDYIRLTGTPSRTALIMSAAAIQHAPSICVQTDHKRTAPPG